MIEELQRANLWKRISAALFDIILLGIVIVGVAYLLSAITGYDTHSQTVSDAYAQYEQQYGVTFALSQEEFDALSAEQRSRYDTAYQALCNDTEAMYAYNMVVNLTLVISSISILCGYLLTEFTVPLLLGSGQTVGKKIFGIALMRTDGIRITAPLLFIRTILGKYTIETMIPVLIIIMIYFNMVGLPAMLSLGGILLLESILLIATRTNSLIHDLLAKTVAVDYASQRIFDSEQELLAYKQRQHAEGVAREPY